ncbi:MAG: gluconate 2-dehydrogenase subunit 3 family protein [Catalinimonas sp.]
MQRREALARVTALMGGALSAPALGYLMGGCDTKTAPAVVNGILTDAQLQTTAELAETIVPTTDTPGAKAAGVPAFIPMMLEECYPQEDRELFQRGLNTLDTRSEERFGRTFAAASAEQRAEVLRTMVEAEDESERTFFLLAKELTLLGYFTSEIGATQVLEYVHVPGRYEGCLPMEPDQRAWAS